MASDSRVYSETQDEEGDVAPTDSLYEWEAGDAILVTSLQSFSATLECEDASFPGTVVDFKGETNFDRVARQGRLIISDSAARKAFAHLFR